MSQAFLTLIDRRKQPTKEYLVAVATSDYLDIKGVYIQALDAEKKPLATANLRIPALEDFDYKANKIIKEMFDNLLQADDKTISFDDFIKQTTPTPEVQQQLIASRNRLEKKVRALLKEFLSSEVINLNQQKRLDALYKLKEHQKDLAGKSVVCIDIEATDLPTNSDADLLQISICDLDGKEILNQLINPGYDIPENVKHNITTEMVADSPFLSHCWDEIHNSLKQADVILAYSSESDFSYLENAAAKKILPFELDYNKWLDVAELSQETVGAMRWHGDRMYWFWKTPRLTDAYEKIFNKPFPGEAHDALADAQATAELMRELLKRGQAAEVTKPKKTEPVGQITNNAFAQAFAKAKRK